MSHMSLLEKTARNASAVSLLNKARHWLQQREEHLTEEEKSILIEALEMNESKHYDKMVIYSFQGFGQGVKSTALQISSALNVSASAGNEIDGKNALNNMKKILTNGKNPGELNGDIRDKGIVLLEGAMKQISGSSPYKMEKDSIKTKGL